MAGPHSECRGHLGGLPPRYRLRSSSRCLGWFPGGWICICGGEVPWRRRCRAEQRVLWALQPSQRIPSSLSRVTLLQRRRVRVAHHQVQHLLYGRLRPALHDGPRGEADEQVGRFRVGASRDFKIQVKSKTRRQSCQTSSRTSSAQRGHTRRSSQFEGQAGFLEGKARYPERKGCARCCGEGECWRGRRSSIILGRYPFTLTTGGVVPW